MKNSLERLLSATLSMAAALIAVALIHREFFAKAPPPVVAESDTPQMVSSWKDALPVGVRFGPASSKVTIVEFADLECPFCRQFHQVARKVMKEHPADVSLVFVQYPLAMHRFARPAARAAECASSSGRFEELVDVVYDKQDSLGIKTWASFGREAGIADSAKFQRCALASGTYPRIEAGLALGTKFQVRGTPTVIVNGWKLPGTPVYSVLDSVVEAQIGSASR